GSLFALEDAIDIAGREAKLLDVIGTVGDQAAGGGEVAFIVDRGQPVPRRKRDDQIAMNDRQRAPCQYQTAIRAPCEGRKRALHLPGVAPADGAQPHPKRRRHGLNCAPQANPGRYGGIANDCYSRHTWRNLLEHLQPFRADAVFIRGKTGDVATRPRQTIDEARADRIGGDHEHDRHVGCRAPQWPHRRAARGEDHVRRKRDEFRGIFASVVLVACGPAIVDLNVVPDSPAQLLQPLQKCRVASLHLGIIGGVGHERAYAPHALGLLRTHRERPRCRSAAEQRYELAPAHHSITSSARATKIGETSKPKALAVLRLTTNSNLVPCSTGRSAGFDPLRILSTKVAERYQVSLRLTE